MIGEGTLNTLNDKQFQHFAKETTGREFAAVTVPDVHVAVTGTIPERFSDNVEERRLQLVQAAMVVFPDNPGMARLAVAQATGEAGLNLDSEIARENNNLYGVKGEGPAGSTPHWSYEKDRTVNELSSFAKYHNIGESIRQRATYFEDRQREKGVDYSGVIAAKKTKDFYTIAQAVGASPYAQDSNYAQLLIERDAQMKPYWDKALEIAAAAQAAETAESQRKAAAASVASTTAPSPEPAKPAEGTKQVGVASSAIVPITANKPPYASIAANNDKPPEDKKEGSAESNSASSKPGKKDEKIADAEKPKAAGAPTGPG
jgi:Mannosyl-glycoprotein endo-beta-N-acetylglucosaminidase